MPIPATRAAMRRPVTVLETCLALVVASSGADEAETETAVEPLRTITVSGVGQTEIEPDQAVVRLGVITRGQSAKAVSRRSAARMSSVLEAVRDEGIDPADIKTTRIDLSPFRRRNQETDQVSTGWQVVNQVKATVPVEQAGDVIDAAIAAGANDLDGVRFRASDPSAAVSAARVAAVGSARAAADELAAAAGEEVLRVLSIVEGDANVSRAYRNGPQLLAESAVFAASAPIEPGMIDVSSSVVVTYEIG